MPDSNLTRVAAWLAEEERKKRPAPRRLFRNAPDGIETAEISQENVVLGRRPDADRTALEAEGYQWSPGDEYAQAVAAGGQPSALPAGALPFISGAPTHKPSKAVFSYIPPRTTDSPMAEAMSGAAGLTVPGVKGPASPPPTKRDPRAVLAKVRGRREVDVRSTKEGPQPTLREPADPLAARPTPTQLPPRVSAHLQGRRQPSGLEDAQRRASVNQLSANLVQSAEYLGAGVGGVRPRPEAFSNLQEQADQPVEQYRQRHAEERQQEQDELALAEAEREATMAAEEMTFRRGRATSEDRLARDRMAQEERLAGKRMEGDAADRALRRQEMRQRREDDMMMKALMADEKDQAKKDREDELDLQRLGTATSKAPFGEFQTALQEIDRLVPGIAHGQVPDEPPLGMGDRIARGLAPVGGEFFMSDKGKSYATAIANLRDLVARMRSGAVLNAGEERHYLALLGDRVLSDERTAAQGINAVRQGIAQKLRNAQAGYTNVLDRFESTGATTYRAPIFGAAPTGEEIQMPNGDVYEVLQDGTTRRRP